MTEELHNEKELLRLIAEGDEVAFKDLFYYYLPVLELLVIRIIKKKEAVPDLIQEIFMRIWLSRDKLTEIDQPKSWIFQIAYYQSFNWLRQQRIRNQAQGVPTNSIDFGCKNSTDERTLFLDTRRFVHEAVERLSPQAKKVYLLSREEGLKPREIAERMELSTQTVKNTLSRSLKSIRTYLCNHGIMVSILAFFIILSKIFSFL